jgi:hypothetical protein
VIAVVVCWWVVIVVIEAVEAECVDVDVVLVVVTDDVVV